MVGSLPVGRVVGQVGGGFGSIFIARAPPRLAQVHRRGRQLEDAIAGRHRRDGSFEMRQGTVVVTEREQRQPLPDVRGFADKAVLGRRLPILESRQHRQCGAGVPVEPDLHLGLDQLVEHHEHE